MDRPTSTAARSRSGRPTRSARQALRPSASRTHRRRRRSSWSAPTSRRSTASSGCSRRAPLPIGRNARMAAPSRQPILIVGGGIGGLAACLALSQLGFPVTVIEQASEIGEIGAGIQLGPNAFTAMDALGAGERLRRRAVYVERLVMMDAIDESEVACVPLGEPFRQRFGDAYAVIHRADIHLSILEEVQRAPNVTF